jgi:hypothetical protein
MNIGLQIFDCIFSDVSGCTVVKFFAYCCTNYFNSALDVGSKALKKNVFRRLDRSSFGDRSFCRFSGAICILALSSVLARVHEVYSFVTEVFHHCEFVHGKLQFNRLLSNG